jgi:pimeloyl-ACP methyl ester carboxylesterase
MSPEVTIHEAQLDGQPVVWRQAPGADVLYLHGVPTSSADWVPFLARGGGYAPDLPGFGRSGKRGDRDYSMHGLATFVQRFVDMVELDRVTLVVHDWGAVGLLWAMREPQRVERLVLINAVPLLAGYRWHRTARIWRTPIVGELAMGAVSRRSIRRALRQSDGKAPSEALVEAILADFDQGTQRAILRLYRSGSPPALARAGIGLGEIECPALIVWGDRDRYIDGRFAQAYADALGGPTEISHVADGGHWPWLDHARVVDDVIGFVR